VLRRCKPPLKDFPTFQLTGSRLADLRISYIAFWGLGEGITHATVFPTLRILEQRDDVASVVLYTFERQEGGQAAAPLMGFSSKMEHRPVWMKKPRGIAGRIRGSVSAIGFLLEVIRRANTDLIVCRSSTAGVFGSLVSMVRGIPLVVESFEPHAGYMADSGTWSRFGLKYAVQRFFEWIQRHRALALLTVSSNYKALLESAHVQPAVHAAPCPVDTDKFRFRETDRVAVRESLGFGADDIVGIYAGKFNDIYYSPEETFALLKAIRENVPGFKFIVLTQHSHEVLVEAAGDYGFSHGEVVVRSVSHEEVGAFLSAADLGFCLVRPSAHRKYCCPIKTGEYWAAELPVVIPEGVGDDSEIIRKTGAGIVLTGMCMSPYAEALKQLVAQRRHPQIAALAREVRSLEWTQRAYEGVFTHYYAKIKQ